MFYNYFHFSRWFTLIIGKYIQLHVCLALNKQSEGCWVSKDKWDITDVDKTYHHPESISLWNYIAMQKLFRVEIAVCVFNSGRACWGREGVWWASLLSLFPFCIPDNSEMSDSLRMFFSFPCIPWFPLLRIGLLRSICLSAFTTHPPGFLPLKLQKAHQHPFEHAIPHQAQPCKSSTVSAPAGFMPHRSTSFSSADLVPFCR